MASVNTIQAPVYRYFLVDLMSNEVLMEVPFQGVSYERGLKNSGEFSGEIPVIEKTRHLGLYENTMPGQTGLYVVRNGVCVWGGIIWARDYNVKSQILNVSASEFTSYFHHRLIWKTLNFQYGCTITTSDVSSSTATTVQNMARNPVAGLGTTYWTPAPGSGTGVTSTRVQGSDSTAPSYVPSTKVSTLYRVTFGSSSAATGGVRYFEPFNMVQYSPDGVTFVPVTISVYFKVSSGTQPVRLRVAGTSSGTEVGPIQYSATKTASTGWQQLVITNYVPNQYGETLNIDVTSTTAWTAGVSLDVTGLRVSSVSDSPSSDIQFFSGDSAKSGDTTYGWQGTAHSSVSSAVTTVAATDNIPSITQVRVDNGTAKDIVVGASVRLDFYEPSDFRFNGFYKVISRDSPTDSQFTIESAVTRKIVSVGRTVDNPSFPGAYNFVDFITDGPHGLTNEDLITVSGLTGSDSQYNGTFKVQVTSDNESDTFTVTLSMVDPANPTGPRLKRNREEQHTVSGTAARYLPAGVVYNNVTLTAKTDTYDYIRGLVNSVWEDFVGIKFADPYLTPGTTQDFDVTKTELSGGYATITTLQPHGLSVGQAVTISQVDALFNGTWEVSDTPSANSFRYALSGNSPETARTITTTNVMARSLENGVATVYIGGYYGGFSVGDVVTIDPAEDFDGFADVFTGTFVITGIPTPQSFTFDVSSTATLPLAYTQRGTVSSVIAGYSLKNGILDVTLSLPSSDFTVGKSVSPSLPYVVPVVEKSVDAANKTKSVTTAAPHNLMVGDVVKVDGVKDSYSISQVSIKNQVATLTTNKPHVFTKGDAIDVTNLQESYNNVKINSVTSTVYSGSTVSFINVSLDKGRHNLQVGALGSGFQPVVRFDNYYSYFPVKTTSISNNVATVTSHQQHTFVPSDIVTLSGITESSAVVSKEIQDGIVILTTSTAHNIQVSDEITVTGLGAPYDTKSGISTVVLSTTDTRVLYQLQDANGNDLSAVNASPSVARGIVASKNSILNGSFTVLDTPNGSTVTLAIQANNSATKQYVSSSSVVLGGLSLLCRASNQGRAIAYVGGVNADAERTVNFVVADLGRNLGAVPLSASRDTTVGAPTAGSLSPLSSVINTAAPRYVVSSFTKKTVSFKVPLNTSNIKEPVKDIGPTIESSGSIVSSSVVNGNLTVTSVDSPTRVTGAFVGTAPLANILESATNTSSTLRGGSWTTGRGIVTEVVSPTRIKIALNNNKTFGPNKNQYHLDVPYTVQPGGQIRKRPIVSANSFGPYPGNSNLGMTFSTSSYSGKNVTPTAYRGHALTSVGDALDEYSGTVDGFEYRIDCAYDPLSNSFSRTFVLIPIDFPNPPPAGEVSPPSRFGADKLVFEYPGNISDVQLKESAENSTTRFFAVGDSGLGGEAANPYSAASANELLNSENDRKWPILDGKESVQDVSDKDILSAYAQQYLKESRPPGADFTITLNGSLQPQVNTFLPGDWCSLIVRDDFVQERLASSLEPRDSAIVRKIDAIKVSVPDGITFPEVVNLSLIAEWDVDKKA